MLFNTDGIQAFYGGTEDAPCYTSFGLPGRDTTLILKFYTAIRGLIYIQTHMDSYSANYVVLHRKVGADDKLA